MTHATSDQSRRLVFSVWRARFLPGILDPLRSAVLVVAAIAVGTIGWSGYVLALPLAFIFPLLWAKSSSRITVAMVSAGYFLAASRGLPLGIATYFGTTVWAGMLLWVAASLSFVAVHTVLWTRPGGWAVPARYLIAAMLMAIPPFGITGWAHPITAAGVLFPGWGWWGLATAVLGLVLMITRAWPAVMCALAGVWIWSALTWMDPVSPQGWRGIDTSMSAVLGSGNLREQHQSLAIIVRKQAAAGATTVILPESALGVLTPTVSRFWSDVLAKLDITLIAGAVVLDADGYQNVAAKLDRSGSSVLYSERMPVPVSMWQPWRTWLGTPGGAEATFFGTPVVEVAGRRMAMLICYEQLLLWPILQSAWYRPAAIVAIGNGWWATGTSIPDIQLASTKAWARLFGLPLITAFNR